MGEHVNLTRGQVVGWRYRVEKQLGQGGFAKVYRVAHLYTHVRHALKVERSGKDTLVNELQVLWKVGGPGAVGPTVHELWRIGNNTALTMDLKGASLHDVNASIGAVSLLMAGVLGLLSRLHKTGYVHRDIKAQNIVYGNPEDPADAQKLYLVDFGLATKFRSAGGEHVPVRRNVRPKGSYQYMSVRCHKQVLQSRRDDLESLAYTAAKLLKKRLPWSFTTKSRPSHSEAAAIKEARQEMVFQGCPREFADFLHYARSLDYDEKPDYSHWQQVFKNITYLNKYTDKRLSRECQKAAMIPLKNGTH